VPTELWHLKFFFSASELAELDGRICGMTLISDTGYPLGFGGVYFENNAGGELIAIAFFYGGPNQIFARKYIKQALRGMQRVFGTLIDMGVSTVYACVDKHIERSETLARWLGAVPTGDSQEQGDIYAITLANTPLTRS
jgi:hypothetical protein